jgi:tetratricopeptide (TPR) repeat protein
MTFLNRWLKRKPKEIDDPDQLRETLFAAVSSQDWDGFALLCQAERGTIFSNFQSWQKVPEAVRNDPQRLQAYGNGLIMVARYFDEELGQPELVAQLRGDDATNLTTMWELELKRAERMEDDLRYGESIKALEALLPEMQKSQGRGADNYVAIAYGHLARSYLQNGEAGKALPATETALEMCLEQNDEEGIIIYLRGLYEVHRYLGSGKLAADYSDELADALQAQNQTYESERARTRANIARAGEPLNRVVVHIDGIQFELKEAPKVRNGTVRFSFERNRMSLRASDVLTEQGKRLIAQGAYEEALRRLREAARADEYDPDPYYHAGLGLLHLERYAEATKSYEATQERAPGWFHCSSMLWLARKLEAGGIHHEDFLAWRTLEDDDEMGAEEKVCLAEQALTATPALAVLHLHYGINLQASGRRDEALAAYRTGLRCCDEPQTRARLLVNLAVLDTNSHDRRVWLEEAAESKADLIAAATAFLFLRDMPLAVQ